MRHFQTGMAAIRLLKPTGPFSAIIRDGKKTFWLSRGTWCWIPCIEAIQSPLVVRELRNVIGTK